MNRPRPRPRLHRRLTLACALVLSAALGAGTLAPAYADSGRSPQKLSAAAQADLVDQYSSLSGALINLYATNSGKTLEDYLASQQVLLSKPALTDPVAAAAGAGAGATTPGDLPTDAPDTTTGAAPATPAAPALSGGLGTLELPTLPALGTPDVLGNTAGATPVSAATLTDLNKQLASAGLTIDTSSYTSLDALARDVVAKSNTADGAVTLAGAKWMNRLSKLRDPKLKKPGVASPAMPGVPKNALVFGLFADKSLTTLVNNNPGLFAAASKSGLGSKALSSAWNQSMLEAYKSSRDDFSQVLPDPCTGGMLAVMASGKASSAKKVSGSGCGSGCVAGGLYLNSQTSAMFAPSTGSSFGNPFSSLWNSTTLGGLQRWQKKQLLEQNPQLTSQMLNDSQPPASAACKASSKATKNALGATLPGIFGQLRTN